ncbi:MAG TPA: DnaA/Hda family protein, partial [Sporichthya sp.]|nr:DnaA/Hda family protein [Sporichthya sp.]
MTDHDPNLTQLWNRALLDPTLADLPQNHRAFLRLTRPIALVEGTAVLAAPTEFARDIIETRMRDQLAAALARESGQDVRIAVTVDEGTADPDALPGSGDDDDWDTDDVELDRVSSDDPTDPVRLAEINTDTDARLNPKYVFERFVTGSSNRFAHAAAVAAAEAPAKAYNPLFIYGESGLGKTHLLHAVGHYTSGLFRGLRVRYVSSEEFTNDFINAIRDGRAESFRARYRNVDVL